MLADQRIDPAHGRTRLLRFDMHRDVGGQVAVRERIQPTRPDMPWVAHQRHRADVLAIHHHARAGGLEDSRRDQVAKLWDPLGERIRLGFSRPPAAEALAELHRRLRVSTGRGQPLSSARRNKRERSS